jgi:hypothetical protein
LVFRLRKLKAAGVPFLAVVCALAAPGAASASTAPLAELHQAQTRSHAAATEATGDIRAKAALGAAAQYLGVATAPSLWIGESDAVPPPEGEAVFADSSAAVKEVKRILNDPTVSAEATQGIVDEVLEAQADLADIALEEVQGSISQSGTPAAKWKSAFKILGKQVTKAATSVPQSTVELAASNYLASEEHELYAVPERISGPPLKLDGKPELFYFGAEGCPFCGVQRWSLVVALAQFGKFSPLAVSVSSPIDFDPSTRTVTFYKSRYKSSYLAFVPLEGYTNQPGEPECNGEPSFPWTILETPSPSEQELIADYDGYEGCPEAVPFIDVANTWATLGSYANPALIAGQSWQQVSASLSDSSSQAGEAIDGGAEIVTAQICEIDGGQPARICASSVVHRYQEEVRSGFAASFPPP